MRIYNTLSKKVEEFVPKEQNKVKMYTCGPTVYNYAHIGNLRYFLFTDVLEKSLRYLGYDVVRAMNITDVGHMTSDADTGEDKMQKGAEREHKTVYEIADFYTRAFFNDFKDLNIKKPEIVEKASDHIAYYQKMIIKLIKDGYAYESAGNVYFDITKFKNYYELSGKNPDDLKVAVRESVDEDKSKRNPGDFGLWFTLSKFSNQVMKWDSPWGVGYPGWHIECSGISTLYLGEYLDIHCGAIDLIFPHHTNEIAQSEAYLGHKWCNYWCHCAYLNDKAGKMSKSSGEFLTLNVLKEKGYDPLGYRYFCLNSHYRNALEFSYESLDTADAAYKKLKARVDALDRNTTSDLNNAKIELYRNKFKEAISNDLNTSSMLTLVYDVLKDGELSDFIKLYLIEDFDNVLSLDLTKKAKKVSSLSKDDILKRIAERQVCKQARNYEQADKIRKELENNGIRLIDTKDGTTYEVI